MERIFDKRSKVIFVLITILCIMALFTNCFAATKLYTNGLKKGDVLQFTATSWNVYSTKAGAANTDSKKIKRSLKNGEKITIQSIATDTNVLKIADGEFIVYGATASKYFKKISSDVKVKSVKLNVTSKELNEKETLQLKATIDPSNATNKNVTWKSSKASVAKVDANGKVTALKAGDTVITVTSKDGNKSASCKIKVKAPTTLKFKKTMITIEMGQTLNMADQLTVTNGNIKDVKWTSSYEAAAKIDKNGKITTVGAHNTTITATLNGAKATCKLSITSKKDVIEVKSVKLNKTSINSMNVGEELTLTATVKVTPDKSGNRVVKFTSSDPSVVSVNEKSGKLKALKASNKEITITATSIVDSNKKVTCKIKKILQPVKTIKVSEDSELNVGDTKTLKAEVLPIDASNKKVKWTSSNTSVATVSSTGVVKAKKAGTAKITVTAQDGSKVYGTCSIKVKAKATYNGVELQYSARYNVSKNPLTKKLGVVYYNGHKETFYSQKVLPGGGLYALNNNGRHVADDGTIRDKDGYIAVACNYLSQGSRIMTSLGPGKVYDTGTMTGAWIDIYVNW